MSKLKVHMKTILSVICVMFTLIGLLSTILFLVGYRLFADDTVKPDWEAVSAIAAFLIPIVVIYIERRINNSVIEGHEKIINELSTFKNEYENKLKTLEKLVTQEGSIHIDGNQVKVTNVEANWA